MAYRTNSQRWITLNMFMTPKKDGVHLWTYLMRQCQTDLELIRSNVGVSTHLQRGSNCRRTKPKGWSSDSECAHGDFSDVERQLGWLNGLYTAKSSDRLSSWNTWLQCCNLDGSFVASKFTSQDQRTTHQDLFDFLDIFCPIPFTYCWRLVITFNITLIYVPTYTFYNSENSRDTTGSQSHHHSPSRSISNVFAFAHCSRNGYFSCGYNLKPHHLLSSPTLASTSSPNPCS